MCTCPEGWSLGAHFSFLVPTIYFVDIRSSGQALKRAHQGQTPRDKCTPSASFIFPNCHEPRKIVGTSERFSKSFFKVFFLKENFFKYFLEVLEGSKNVFWKKDLWVRTFKQISFSLFKISFRYSKQLLWMFQESFWNFIRSKWTWYESKNLLNRPSLHPIIYLL